MKPEPLRIPDTVTVVCTSIGKSGMDAYLTGYDSAEEHGKASMLIVGKKSQDFVVGAIYNIAFLQVVP